MEDKCGTPKNRRAVDKRSAASKPPSERAKPAAKIERFAFPFVTQPLEGVAVPLPPETEEEAADQMSENIFHGRPNYEKKGLEKEESGEWDKAAEHTLCKQYEEKIRPCIDLIDSLRALGLEKDLSLPAIAVIGDQSSGKSSVLEALSGVALPKGSGIVTRCPLELKLKRLPKGQAWQGRLGYRNVVMDLQSASEVDRAVRQAQDAVAGPRGAISGELISLEVRSPDVPDLTLIDLPGIARVAVGDQPKDIGEQIKVLLKEIIGCKETINLVVVPCNVDIATIEALKMAQEVDPSGEKTLGILTKPDLVDRGTEETIIRIMQNTVVPLKKGYMIVKCRGQQDIHNKVTLASAIQQERNFFASHRHFSVLMEEGKATIPHLSEKLTNELVKHIIKSLPTLQRQIHEMLHKTLQDLQKYNRNAPKTESEKLIFLTDLIKLFNQDISQTMRGEEQLFGDETRLFAKIRWEFQRWKLILLACDEQAKKSVSSKVNKYEQQYRGREFPGFTNYRTFEDIIKEQILELEEPAIGILYTVIEMVEEKFRDIVNRNFADFHNLSRAAKMRIEDIKGKQAVEAERHIRTQFKMERIVYCQDDIYLFDLNAVKANMPQNVVRVPTEEPSFVQEMVSHTKAYFSGASKRLSNQIPLIILSSVLHDFGENIQSTMLQLLQEKDKLDVLLEEDAESAKRRNCLNQRVHRLTKACQYLREFSSQ